MNTSAEAPNSGARSPENSVPTQSVPGKTDNLINQLNNISNVLYSKDVSEEYPKHLDNKKKSREHLKRFIYPKNDPEPSPVVDSRTDQEKLMSVLRTLSCVLNRDQVDLWSEICQRDLRTSEQYKS